MKLFGVKAKIMVILGVSSLSLMACQKNPDTKVINHNTSTATTQTNTQTMSNSSADTLIGCFTVSKTEPAQIKINRENGNYNMQMREFNDPDKPWDKPEAMQELPKTEVKTYFDVDEKSVEKVITRPDHVFVLAKVQDSLMNLDKRFDSNYLGYIYKGSNTVYKVECGK